MSNNINNVLDNAAGKAQNTQGESLSTFLASLTTSGAIFGLGIVAYMFLQFKVPEIYSRRARHTPDLKWKPAMLSSQILFLPMPDPILNHASGFDNYFFERYLHTIVRIFVLLGLTIPPILLPLNFIDGRNAPGGVKGLDRLSFSNIGPSHTDRYWAHLALAIFVVVSVCVTLQHELRDYRRLRNSLGDFAWDAYEPLSVLLVSKSNEQLSINAIRPHFSNVAGGIYNITVNRDYSSLHAKLRKRDRSIENLEIAATNLIIKANCRRKLLREQEDEKDGERGRPMPLWMKYLYPKDRPSTRIQVRTWIPCLPFLGPQVDTICHFRKEVAQYNLEVEWDQRYPSKFPETNSAFVYFNKRLSMPLAALVLKTSVPPSWTLKLGTTPDDTIWQNVSISWWQQCIRRAAVYLLVAVLTLGFAFPVTIIGTLSQIKYLANVVSWLHWINKLPTWLVAVIQGVLPPTMLALITAMVPVVFRFLANVQGHYSRRVVENHIQIYYFTFLFVQVFLTVSLSAGITTIIGELKDTIETVPAVLAINLPKACNYFFSYIMIHTLSTIMQTLLQISLLVELLILSPILDKTARHMWARGRRLDLQKWGTFIPVLTNIACVGLIYSVIAPLILFFSIIYFGALWILYQSYPPKLTGLERGTSGLFYPTAIRQLLTGIYFMELCLAGLFFLVRDTDGNAACTAQAVIMIIVTVLTVLFHYTLDHSHWVNWLPFPDVLKQKLDQIGSRGKLDWRCRTDVSELSTTKPRVTPEDLAQDEALRSPRPVVWIPKDEFGIADDLISYIRRTHDSLWISNEGASLDEQGKLKLWGAPPKSSK